jgi:Tol biopolymer transport system component
LITPLKINLKEKPEPLTISRNAKFLNKGNDFNDFYYLAEGTLFKARGKASDSQRVQITEQRAITNPRIADVTDMIWSPTKDLALLKKPDQVNLFDFKKYDFVNQTEELWGKNIGSIAWSPDNSKVAYYYAPSSGEKSLVFSNLTNKEMNRVLNLNEQKIDNPLLRWSRRHCLGSRVRHDALACPGQR